MKKVINVPEQVVEETLQGFELAYPQYVRRVEGFNVLVRADSPIQGKVALISGGGSGHEPSPGGFVGRGMLDGAVAGDVFTAPAREQVYKAIKTADGGHGVLLIVQNYTADIMSFDMAADMAEADGIKVDKVIVNDDVAIENTTRTTGRRGMAGTIFVHKITGAMAETGADLSEVKRVAKKVIANVRSIGIALSPCTVPVAGKPGFTLAENEMEMGVGIHGEPGATREIIKPADEIVTRLLDKILADMPLTAGSQVAVMINGLGSIPLMELHIINRKVAGLLAQQEIDTVKTYVGNYMTSLDTAGFSISLLKLDPEMKKLLLAAVDTPAFVQN